MDKMSRIWAGVKNWGEFLLILTVVTVGVAYFYGQFLDSMSGFQYRDSNGQMVFGGAPDELAVYRFERQGKLIPVYCSFYIFGILGKVWLDAWKHAKYTDSLESIEPEDIESEDNNPEDMEPMDFAGTRESLREDMENVVRQWVKYETDPVKMLDYPMLSMMSFPPTADFHRCLLDTRKSFRNNVSLDALHDAVVELEHRYRVMIAEARRSKWNNFLPAEQNHLRKAQKLLNMAVSPGSSVQERRLVYKRLMMELEGILVLAPATIEEIESRVMLGIED